MNESGLLLPDGTTQTTAINSLTDLSVTATAAELNLLDGVTASTAEINKLDGVTSNIQTQIDNISTDVVSDTTPQLGGNLDTNSNNINFGDNDKAQFGASSDLQIYHDGSHSIIKDAGTGDLKVQATNLRLTDVDNTNYIRCIDGGAVELYNNAGVKLATTSTGVDVTGEITTDGLTTSADINFGDNDKAVFGAGSDLQIYHSGTSSRIQDLGTGNLIIDTNGTEIQLTSGNISEYMLRAVKDGAVQLYYDNSQKLITTADGVDITGTGALKLPVGTTAQQPSSPTAGDLRWNSDDTSAEIYDGSAWGAVGGGGASTTVYAEHANTLSENLSIASGNNAVSGGPITINSGYSVTVPSGSVWTIV